MNQTVYKLLGGILMVLGYGIFVVGVGFAYAYSLTGYIILVVCLVA